MINDTIDIKLQELLNKGLSGDALLEAWVTIVTVNVATKEV